MALGAFLVQHELYLVPLKAKRKKQFFLTIINVSIRDAIDSRSRHSSIVNILMAKFQKHEESEKCCPSRS